MIHGHEIKQTCWLIWVGAKEMMTCFSQWSCCFCKCLLTRVVSEGSLNLELANKNAHNFEICNKKSKLSQQCQHEEDKREGGK
jgi:hypothetical protein